MKSNLELEIFFEKLHICNLPMITCNCNNFTPLQMKNDDYMIIVTIIFDLEMLGFNHSSSFNPSYVRFTALEVWF